MLIGQTDNVPTDNPDDGDSVVFNLSALVDVPSAEDIIPDFGAGDGDVIDLATLLDGALAPLSSAVGEPVSDLAVDLPGAVGNDTYLPLDTVALSYWSVDAGLNILYDDDSPL
ncbi:type I secretion C-terminal target domain-containing protein [Aquamicrobium soli]|uniref:Type I secretion C-terminal target domain-containing protein n=1 Tax=Aquamicrobium soli TaxID=1811518 RepID=A0ABV7KGK0_9HYPH